jgi:DNA polymerase III sliding clamp (beta) subunit (PCNA family)
MKRTDDGVQLTVVSRDVGEATEEVVAEYDAPDILAFNARYLADMLKATDGGKVSIGIAGMKPAIIGGLDHDTVQLLMPVRVS